MLLGPNADEADVAEVDVVEAHIVLDQPGSGQIDRARALAERAAAVADRVPLPVVACQAWQLLGWLYRLADTEMATTCLERARETAVRHDLPMWEIHALVRLGNDDGLRHARLDRLEQVRAQADLVGAVHVRYQSEQSLARFKVFEGDFAAAEALLDEVFPAVSRLKLVECVHFVLQTRVILAAHRGRREEMEKADAELGAWGGHELPLYQGRIQALARVYCALLEEDRPLAIEEQAAAVGGADDPLTTRHGRYGMNLLLNAIAGTIDRAGFEAVAAEPAAGLRWDRMFALFARAVLIGRAGAADEATTVVADALAVGAPYAMGSHLGLRLAAEAALADGWGEPVDWLQSAEHYFHRAGIPAVARACRELLVGNGAHVAQRQVRTTDVPPALRDVGVTPREYEVLLLLCDRLSNREIADRLQISHRTVENHVSSSIMKTGLPDRFALAKYVTNLPNA
jgi:DNA-binding CsgD family transcriptional regulator